MKQVYSFEFDYNTTIYCDKVETICVIGKNIPEFYYAVTNPQFPGVDVGVKAGIYVFDSLINLIDYFGENGRWDKHQMDYDVRIFLTEDEYNKWYNNLPYFS